METKETPSLITKTKEDAKEALGCIFLILVGSCIIMFFQELGVFDNLTTSESTPMTQPGDPYPHGDAF